MRNSQELHKTVVRDIISFTEDGTIKDFMDLIDKGAEVKNKFISDKKQSGSIARRASDLVLVFPVLVSTSLKMSTATLISKAIEKKCVSLLQLLFSAVDLKEYKDSKDLFDYISKFHTNINRNGISLDDFMTAMSNAVTTNEVAITDKDAYNMVMESLKGINDAANDALRESSINDYHVNTTMYGRTNVTLEADTDSSNTKRKKINLNSEVISNEMKKANELVPTMMTVNYLTVTSGGNAVVQRTGVIGVKAKMYPVDHTEIIGRLSSKYSDSNTLFSLIRCSTKEKSFFKDFAFALEKTKLDAINIAKGSVNSKLFRTLERRAARDKIKLLKSGDASPITSLVVSQEEVEYLKKYSNMDIEKISTARVILNGYNLLYLVIVDDSLEIAKILEDNDDNIFETITYDSLKKEDKNGDYRKIINLMSQMNR